MKTSQNSIEKSSRNLHASATSALRHSSLTIHNKSPRFYQTLESGSTAAMTHLIPSFALNEEKVELIILVDRSGSMGGYSIRMASAALQLFLHSLPTDCYFSVIGFGSSYELLFKEGSLKYGPESLHETVNYAKSISANLGGTEILAPLKDIYSRPHIRGYLRQIFVITDGAISNTDQVISLVKQNAHNSRLFALGIGPSASHYLVQGIATAGGGTCAFVEGDDSIQNATLSQLKNSLQPSLTEINLEWIGLSSATSVELNPEKTLFGYNKPLQPEIIKEKTFSQSPKNIPPIFDGQQMVVFGIFHPGVDKPSGVMITANSPDGPLTLNISMSDANVLGNTEMLHKLAVVKLIRELEIEETSMRDKFTSEIIKDQIISLGVKHGITSKHTSYIAVDENRRCLDIGFVERRQVLSLDSPAGPSRHYVSMDTTDVTAHMSMISGFVRSTSKLGSRIGS
ncbi:von Willebrand factor A domain-containing protein DDB_G0292740 [Folsomia candida]|uniref:von Willebrand factor A domain-containing protein DDB_G0292740 n=1 Tax=Folsomia candida TaxID=158441 RepID=UPI0016054ABA|nr:von Willebrand factor A domain-containing protein DDB_G0292740 [Folsomia candida]XP_035700371.1 von Willebrand factor A domain-containing protein DDB_G0292740 [Folsomia candida]XP_035700372.1 von Willebrand factor A domain-containing protein DDB_G0292740 [Folsomia candida]XP_035700373.1 von Willebrand factor A domain-containing protein DDB_G0292740 [Folsomia candida]XP_035700374.1 von Willebrand factor A domain-containing protein DDB_G0292740 [Folsomia candida]XP_035700375.1 von Willebrand 